MNTDEVLINYKRLPDFDQPSLKYRCQVLSSTDERRYMLMVLSLLSLAAVFATILIRLFGDLGTNPNALAIFGIAGVLTGVAVFAIRRRGKLALTLLLVVAAAPLLAALMALMLQSRIALVCGTILAALIAAWLADSIVTHYHAWKLAAPSTAEADADYSATCWASRVIPVDTKATLDSTKMMMQARHGRRINHVGPRFEEWARVLRWFPLSFAVPAVLLFGFLPYRAATVPLLFVLLAGVLIASCVFCHRRKLVWYAPLQEAGDALQSWLNYSRKTPPAPGLFVSPSGSPKTRLWITICTFGFFCFAALPAVDYMPSWITWLNLQRRVVAFSQSVDANTPVKDLANRIVPAHKPSDVDDIPALQARAMKLGVFPEKLARYELADRYPGAWIPPALTLAVNGDSAGTYSIAISLVLCFLFPPLVLCSTLVGMSAFALVDPALCEPTPVEEGSERYPLDTDWARYERRLHQRYSPEQSHLWIGAHAHQDYPVLLHQDILREHAYLVGDSGSGKTALGLMPILSQLIRRRDAAVVVIDLKGDPALFNTVREEARLAGSTFRFFSNELGRHTHAFNPFIQADLSKLTLNQVCEAILEALNLNHGEGYGRSYYSRVARRWLSSILRQRPSISSFEELYEAADDIENFRDEKERQDAFELVSVIESLASFEQINLTPSRGDVPPDVHAESIFMPRVITNREVVYFWLPAAVETASVREIAKLAVYSLLRAAFQASRDQPRSHQSFLVIDEFQRMASSGFKLILEQARSMGVGCILANQTPGDLEMPDTDLRPTVHTNTRLKVCFSASDPNHQDDLMRGSGEASGWLRAVPAIGEHAGEVASLREHMTTRLLRNDLLAISDDPLQCVFQVSRGLGYTQFAGRPLPVKMQHMMPEHRYRDLKQQPWPEDVKGTLLTTRRALDPTEFHSAQQRLRAVQLLIDEFTDSRRTVIPGTATPQKSPVPVSVVEPKPIAVPQAVNAGSPRSGGPVVGTSPTKDGRPSQPGSRPQTTSESGASEKLAVTVPWHERLRKLQEQINANYPAQSVSEPQASGSRT